ncbi:MAG TPA: selenide, water dikinase SelD, partial [bacterium]|nr:selenide, water dikinase SelD [bacterium]
MLGSLPHQHDPNLLVGTATSDDAGVYRIAPDQALVFTVDFITPPVDDPYLFGQVAAANALSDVYAMGGKPLTCMNLVGFPSKKLPGEVLKQIVAGAMGKIQEAGAVLVGGHSTEDEEPKFGLSVTGVVHPDKIWRNDTARVGDKLVLTKPIGSGVLFNANRKGLVSATALQACLGWCTQLNKVPAEVAAGFEIHACTDITGFGLAGHTFNMAKGSLTTFVMDLARVPVM